MTIDMETFSRLVKERICPETSIMDAVLETLTVLEIPVEDAARYLDENLIAVIEREAVKLHMVKGKDGPSIEEFM